MTGRNRARIYHITEWALIQRDERAGVPETSLARAGGSAPTAAGALGDVAVYPGHWRRFEQRLD
jgi:hypothetical protein